LIIFARTLVSFNKNANPEVGKKSSGAGADTSSAHIHQVPSRIPRCLAMSFDLEQGPRRTRNDLGHLAAPQNRTDSSRPFSNSVDKKTVSASIKHQNINPTGSISAVSKPQTHQAMVGPFEQPVLVSSSDHSTASMFLFVRAWSSSKLSSHTKEIQGGSENPLLQKMSQCFTSVCRGKDTWIRPFDRYRPKSKQVVGIIPAETPPQRSQRI